MKQRLGKDEHLLVGKWIFQDGKVVEDDTSKRIKYLIHNVLNKIANSQDGWEALYLDPSDHRYWELTYPQSSLHGGGAPTLKNIARKEAILKYGII